MEYLSPSNSEGANTCEHLDIASVSGGDLDRPNSDPLLPSLLNCQGTSACITKRKRLLKRALCQLSPPLPKSSQFSRVSDRQAPSCIDGKHVNNPAAEDTADQSTSVDCSFRSQEIGSRRNGRRGREPFKDGSKSERLEGSPSW